MCKKGFGNIFETHISPQKASYVSADQGTDDYWRQVIKARERSFTKPRAAMEIISEIEQQGEAVIPIEVTEIIRNAIAISRNAL